MRGIRTAKVKVSQEPKGYYVDLYKNGDLFGTIDIHKHSIYYAQDVVFNWESGVLEEDNPHIERVSNV